MAVMNQKFSGFIDGGDIQPGDTIVGLRSGLNTKFLYDTNIGFSWSTITAASITAVANAGYVANRSATPVQILLPALFNVGDEVIVMGLGNGGWSLIANASQVILFGSVSTSVDGAINSDITNSVISVRGLVANTTWIVNSTNSNPTYI